MSSVIFYSVKYSSWSPIYNNTRYEDRNVSYYTLNTSVSSSLCVNIIILTNSPLSLHVAPSNPIAQLQVLWETHIPPFSQDGSQVTA